MALRSSIYGGDEDVRHAVRALEAAGVQARDFKADSRLHDVRWEPVGGFGGPVGPDAPVGKFAGPPRRRRQAAGGWAGDPDRQRQGSFADAEFGQEAV